MEKVEDESTKQILMEKKQFMKPGDPRAPESRRPVTAAVKAKKKPGYAVVNDELDDLDDMMGMSSGGKTDK
jgi:hypothetical protein